MLGHRRGERGEPVQVLELAAGHARRDGLGGEVRVLPGGRAEGVVTECCSERSCSSAWGSSDSGPVDRRARGPCAAGTPARDLVDPRPGAQSAAAAALAAQVAGGAGHGEACARRRSPDSPERKVRGSGRSFTTAAPPPDAPGRVGPHHEALRAGRTGSCGSPAPARLRSSRASEGSVLLAPVAAAGGAAAAVLGAGERAQASVVALAAVVEPGRRRRRRHGRRSPSGGAATPPRRRRSGRSRRSRRRARSRCGAPPCWRSRRSRPRGRGPEVERRDRRRLPAAGARRRPLEAGVDRASDRLGPVVALGAGHERGEPALGRADVVVDQGDRAAQCWPAMPGVARGVRPAGGLVAVIVGSGGRRHVGGRVARSRRRRRRARTARRAPGRGSRRASRRGTRPCCASGRRR